METLTQARKDEKVGLTLFWTELEKIEDREQVTAAVAHAVRRFFARMSVRLGLWLPAFTLQSNGSLRLRFQIDDRSVELDWAADGQLAPPLWVSWNGQRVNLPADPDQVALALANLPAPTEEEEAEWERQAGGCR